MTNASDPTPPPHLLELYRWAVQDPETHATVLRIMYETVRPGRVATVLREDFAGTAAESVAWVALKQGRRSIAVDLDADTNAWARARAERLLGARAGAVEFIHGDSLRVGPPAVPAADIISVLNFSILYLRDGASLATYLRHARACLAADGVLVLNLFGGAGALRPGTMRHSVSPRPRLSTEHAIPPFEYLWEVRAYDGGTGALDCRIHFEVPNGRAAAGKVEIRDAFRYSWRLWSPAELMAACHAAGYSEVRLWRHTYDPSKGAEGVFLGPVEAGAVDRLDQWSAYIVAAV